jgi:cyclic pyranopterin monophosphate synthase
MALTHLNQRGEAHIVDIADKATTRRRAVATARLEALPETIALILGGWRWRGLPGSWRPRRQPS